MALVVKLHKALWRRKACKHAHKRVGVLRLVFIHDTRARHQAAGLHTVAHTGKVEFDEVANPTHDFREECRPCHLSAQFVHMEARNQHG